MMGYSCLHTHTVFCDGSDDVETFCQTAWEKGFCSLGFSAHAPITKKTGIQSEWHLPGERMEAYLDAVRQARRRWEGKLPIYLGLEVDYISALMGPADQDYHDLGLDYLIGSVHYIIPPKGKPFTVDGSRAELEQGIQEGFNGDGEALMHAYWDAEAAMIHAGGFDILGHADLIKKNNQHDPPFFDPSAPAYLRRTEEIAALAGKAAAQWGIAVEVNTGGMTRGKLNEPYPSVALLTAFQNHQVPAIITADAHTAQALDSHYPEALEAMRKASYTTQVFFEGRLGPRPQWRQAPV
jgi:histidinol-phosphatase (PHP family)